MHLPVILQGRSLNPRRAYPSTLFCVVGYNHGHFQAVRSQLPTRKAVLDGQTGQARGWLHVSSYEILAGITTSEQRGDAAQMLMNMGEMTKIVQKRGTRQNVANPP